MRPANPYATSNQKKTNTPKNLTPTLNSRHFAPPPAASAAVSPERNPAPGGGYHMRGHDRARVRGDVGFGGGRADLLNDYQQTQNQGERVRRLTWCLRCCVGFQLTNQTTHPQVTSSCRSPAPLSTPRLKCTHKRRTLRLLHLPSAQL